MVTARKELEGRTAVVTGSARNIGRAIALAFAQAGASVVVNALHASAELEAVVAEIRAAGGQAVGRIADVGDPAQGAALIEAAVQAFGGVDILVNNAAIRSETEFAAITYQEWRGVLSTILDGAFLTVQAALPHLARSGGGAIVNIGGLSAHTGAPRRAHVIAAKAGLVGLTRALAHDLAAQGITVNCVVPGTIDTVRGTSASAPPHLAAGHSPLVGRKGKPEEIAELVLYLSSPRARYLTGQTIHASGGAFLP